MTFPKIITFTGASGSGKSTLIKLLGFSLVTSTTIREPRYKDGKLVDLPGEYEHVSLSEFSAIRERGEFVWPKKYGGEVEPGGNLYGTKREYVDAARDSLEISAMTLIPDVIPLLLEYAGDIVLPFYIESPGDDILRDRLKKRGENKESIEKRLEQSKRWDEEAKNSNIPYIFIDNPERKIKHALRNVKVYLTGF